jgi:hypothetical protein
MHDGFLLRFFQLNAHRVEKAAARFCSASPAAMNGPLFLSLTIVFGG